MLIKNLAEQRSIQAAIGNASQYAKWLLDQGGSTVSGAKVSENTAETLPVVYACINVLSQTLAHTPLELLKKNRDGGADKAINKSAYGLVNTKPNPEQTSFAWRETIEGHRNGWGNAYTQIIRENQVPIALRPLTPTQVEPQRIKGNLVYQIYDGQGQPASTVFAQDMLHFAGRGWDGCKGYSPIQVAREAIGLGMAVHQFGSAFFGRGASPKGVIEAEVSANTLAPFVEEFKKNFGGLDNAQGTPILPKGMTYKPLSVNPNDAQALESMKYNRSEICGIYRVPPSFVMDLERSTFTNAVEMDLHFVKHTMVPIFTRYEQELDLKLLTDKERKMGYCFKFDLDGLLRGAMSDRYAAYHTALQDGWVSRAEVRMKENMPKGSDELSEFLTPNNMVAPLDESSIVAEPVETPDEQPLVDSISERMSSNVRQTVERVQDDIFKLDEFIQQKYPLFITRTVMPTAKMICKGTGCSPESFVAEFTKRHIECLMSQPVNRVGDMRILESDIVKTFYEVKHELT